MDDLISRQSVLKAINNMVKECDSVYVTSALRNLEVIVADVPPAQPETHEERTETHGVCLDTISRKAAIDAHYEYCNKHPDAGFPVWSLKILEDLPSAQPERYTKEELRVFQHGISLSLLSKRSAQHWRYDEDTATEIEFLERLYEKVGADMRGEQDG